MRWDISSFPSFNVKTSSCVCLLAAVLGYELPTFITAIPKQSSNYMACRIIIFHQKNLQWSNGEKTIPIYCWPLRLLLRILQPIMDLDCFFRPLICIFNYLIAPRLIFLRWAQALPLTHHSIPNFFSLIPCTVLSIHQPSLPTTIIVCLNKPHQPDSKRPMMRDKHDWVDDKPAFNLIWSKHMLTIPQNKSCKDKSINTHIFQQKKLNRQHKKGSM